MTKNFSCLLILLIFFSEISYSDLRIRIFNADNCAFEDVPKTGEVDKIQYDKKIFSSQKLNISEFNNNCCLNQKVFSLSDYLDISLKQTSKNEKTIPISKFSIQKIFKDQVWLKVGRDIYVASVGDIIGNVVIQKINFDKNIVETSKGKIK